MLTINMHKLYKIFFFRYCLAKRYRKPITPHIINKHKEDVKRGGRWYKKNMCWCFLNIIKCLKLWWGRCVKIKIFRIKKKNHIILVAYKHQHQKQTFSSRKCIYAHYAVERISSYLNILRFTSHILSTCVCLWWW